jgi:hypothetical protein
MTISFDNDFSKPFGLPPFFERIHLLDLASCLNILLGGNNDLVKLTAWRNGALVEYHRTLFRFKIPGTRKHQVVVIS